MLLGSASVVLALAVFFNAVAPGVGLLLAVLVVIAGYLISKLKHDKLQHWLDQCEFGKHKLNSKGAYRSLDEQNTAYRALAQGS